MHGRTGEGPGDLLLLAAPQPAHVPYRPRRRLPAAVRRPGGAGDPGAGALERLAGAAGGGQVRVGDERLVREGCARGAGPPPGCECCEGRGPAAGNWHRRVFEAGRIATRRRYRFRLARSSFVNHGCCVSKNLELESYCAILLVSPLSNCAFALAKASGLTGQVHAVEGAGPARRGGGGGGGDGLRRGRWDGAAQYTAKGGLDSGVDPGTWRAKT